MVGRSRCPPYLTKHRLLRSHSYVVSRPPNFSRLSRRRSGIQEALPFRGGADDFLEIRLAGTPSGRFAAITEHRVTSERLLAEEFEVEVEDGLGRRLYGCCDPTFAFRCRRSSTVRRAPVTTPGRDWPGKMESPTRKRLLNRVRGPRTLKSEV